MVSSCMPRPPGSVRADTAPPSQTPWQEIQRGIVDELAGGIVLKPAVSYQRLARAMGPPQHNH